MAIETAIQDLTAAIRDLLAQLKTSAAPLVTTQAEAPKAEATKPAPVEPVSAAPKAEAATPAETAPTTEVTYDQVKAAILKVVTTKGNEAAAAVLEQFGVKKGPALKAEQYAAVVAACEAA